MKISDIIYREEYILSEVNENEEFGRICLNSNELCDGDILIITNEINAPIWQKIKATPKAVICSPNLILPHNILSIRVNNPRLSLANAFYRQEQFSDKMPKIIGVTGTNGKTTTATLISDILSKQGYKVGFIGTGKIEVLGIRISEDNYSMTTPDPSLLYPTIKKMQDFGCEYIVMEVSSHALALDKVAPLKFDYSVFTNLSEEHLDFHGNCENYYEAKKKLFKNSRCKVINIDDNFGLDLFTETGGKKISVGAVRKADIYATNVVNMGFDGLYYTYHGNDFSFRLTLNFPGIYNVYNSMLAAAVCIDIGCKPCEVKKAIKEIRGIEGRYEIIKDKVSVIIDYAHTAEAFEYILRELSYVVGPGKLTVVFGCGGNRDKKKRPLMAKSAEKYAHRIIITSDNSRDEKTQDIISEIIKGFSKGNYEIKENRKDAIKSAILDAKDGDIVAVIGKGPEKYNIDNNGYHPFDEKEIIQAALKARYEEV